MRTLRGFNGVPPISEVGTALSNYFVGLARPMGSLAQEVFVSVVAHVHTECAVVPEVSGELDSPCDEVGGRGVEPLPSLQYITDTSIHRSEEHDATNSVIRGSGDQGQDSIICLVQGFRLSGAANTLNRREISTPSDGDGDGSDPCKKCV